MVPLAALDALRDQFVHDVGDGSLTLFRLTLNPSPLFGLNATADGLLAVGHFAV